MSVIGTMVGALMALAPRARIDERERNDKDEIARLNRRIDGLARSQAQLIEHVVAVEAERNALRVELERMRRSSMSFTQSQQNALAQSQSLAQAQMNARQIGLGLQLGLQALRQDLCNCVPSRGQMFAVLGAVRE